MREYRDFIDEVNKVKECEFDKYDNMRYCRCETEKDQGWPTVSVYVGDDTSKFWLYLHGKDYLIKHDHRPDYKCSIMIIEDSGYFNNLNPYILMGDPFLRAYYTVYDIENR